MMNKIAIIISTHNRPKQFKKTYEQINKFLPPNSKIFVVDDNSKPTYYKADFKYEKNVGIAVMKNRSLSLAYEWGATDIFLYDDDIYPIHKDWYKPYIESPYPHLQYLFERFKTVDSKFNRIRVIYEDDKIKAADSGRGCMLYIKNEVLKTAGGLNTEYGRYGGEHKGWSYRIANIYNTSYVFMDVQGSENLFHSMDEHGEVQSTVGAMEKLAQQQIIKPLLMEERVSKWYIDYS